MTARVVDAAGTGIGASGRRAGVAAVGLLTLLLIPVPASAAVFDAPRTALGAASVQEADTTGTVVGQVLDSASDEPVEGAEVELTVAGGSRTARTGPEGLFRFEEVPAGARPLRASAAGYRADSAVATVPAGDTVRVELSLAPSPGEVEGMVVGRILNARTGAPVEGAAVRVSGTEIGVLSDSTAGYRLVDVPPGRHTLVVRRIGFAVNRVTLRVPVGGALRRDIRLGETALEMEGIEVTVSPGERAEGELGTASVIDLDAIRHQTASSLAGLLPLVPGVEAQPPGLGGVQQIGLRGTRTSGAVGRATGASSSELTSFGTVVILDGVPMSNNANLQSTGPRGEISFTTSAGGGVDLRRVPASTLERVEVIRGVPSSRWGDITQGAIVVDSRAGEVEPEVGTRYDARTGEASMVGGRTFGGESHTGTLLFDVARSELRPGVADDETYRFAGQLAHRYTSGSVDAAGGEEGAFTLDSRVDFFRLVEDLPPNPNVRGQTARLSEDTGLRVTEDAELRLGSDTRFDLLASFTGLWQQDSVQTQRIRPAMPFTDSFTEGRREGFYVAGTYTSDLEVGGQPNLLFSRLELDARRRWLGARHRLRAGTVLRREWNSGEGRQFDIARPPQVTFNGVQGFDRPRSFEPIPALTTSAFYVDDQIRATLGGTLLEAQLGLRTDLLHEGSSWFSGVRDAVFQPRANLRVAPFEGVAFKAGAGRLTKTPSVGALYPAPQYFDVINVNYFVQDFPDERLAVLTTFIEDPTNPDLGFTEATKLEAGLELDVGGGLLEVVGFRDRIEGGVGIRNVPITITRDRFALTDSVVGNGVKPEIIEPAKASDPVPVLVNRPTNLVDQTSRGFELVGLFPEIAAIDTRFQVTGSWVWTEQSVDVPLFGGPAGSFSDFQLNENDERHPYWDGLASEGESGLLTYRAIHQRPEVGLVLTATVQHNVYDEIRDASASDTLAFAGYVTREAELVPVPRSQRGERQFDDLRVPRGGLLNQPTSTPGDALLTVQVSKTLPLGGRLNFWAFNVFDNAGIFSDADTLGRFFSPMRFGMEAWFRPAELFGGWGL